MQVVDSAGTVQNSYVYDEWGNTVSETEKVENHFKYAGEIQDKETGLYYLRARYYDPMDGRFLNRDTYEGDISNPTSQNLFTYCGNNPLKYVDPSGHDWGASILVAGSVGRVGSGINDASAPAGIIEMFGPAAINKLLNNPAADKINLGIRLMGIAYKATSPNNTPEQNSIAAVKALGQWMGVKKNYQEFSNVFGSNNAKFLKAFLAGTLPTDKSNHYNLNETNDPQSINEWKNNPYVKQARRQAQNGRNTDKDISSVDAGIATVPSGLFFTNGFDNAPLRNGGFHLTVTVNKAEGKIQFEVRNELTVTSLILHDSDTFGDINTSSGPGHTVKVYYRWEEPLKR
ncbi:MAG: RHS repeat-associated core domain-containing protein [Solirubrobacterales bacterium]